MLSSRLARVLTLPRVLLAALATAAAVLLVVVVPVGATTAGTPVCSASSLRLDRTGHQGFTSHREWDFLLRNVTSHSCQLRGYPSVTLLNVHAASTGVSAAHNHSVNITTRTLAPWGGVSFKFVFTVSGPCLPHFFKAYGLRVTPPGASGHLGYYAGAFDVCSVSIGGHPTVTAVF